MAVRIRQKIKGNGNPWYVFVHYEGQQRSIKAGYKKVAQHIADKIEAKLHKVEQTYQAGKLLLRGEKGNYGQRITVKDRAI